jgi:hypothetical protein
VRANFQMPTALELGCFMSMKPTPESAHDLLTLSDEDLIAELLAESEAHRLLACCALHAVHGVWAALERLREQHHQLQAECRDLRELILRESA